MKATYYPALHKAAMRPPQTRYAGAPFPGRSPIPPKDDAMAQSVLIVGAGPVGLTMALELARYGVRVRVIDKSAAASTTSKAIVIWSRTLELLDRAGCAEAFVAAGHRAFGMNMFAGPRRIGHVDLGGVASPYPFVLLLAQSETERLLEAKLATFGVTVERGTEFLGLATEASRITATLRHAGGPEETVTAEWLVGCDGAHSAVRHGLGMEFPGEALPNDWLLADLHLQGLPVPDTEMAGYLHEDGVLMFFPLAPGRYRLIGDLGLSEGAGPPATPTLDRVRAIVARRVPEDVTISDAIWLSAFRINERQVTHYRSGRVFLAGDAAHVHSPAGGQGMNTGMQDAINLAWKLALRCHGTTPNEALLDSYEAERHPVGAQVIAGAGRLTQAATLKNPIAQAVRNFAAHLVLGFAPVQHAMADAVSEISIGYPDSPLTAVPNYRLTAPDPGARVEPQEGEPPFGAGNTPCFAILATPAPGFDALHARHADLLESMPRLAPDPQGIWLVRPDGYVATTATRGEWDAIADYLERLRDRAAD